MSAGGRRRSRRPRVPSRSSAADADHQRQSPHQLCCKLYCFLFPEFLEIQRRNACCAVCLLASHVKWSSTQLAKEDLHRRQRRRGCRGRDPQYLTCRGRPVLTTPNILTSVLFFSPSAELLNTASRSHFHLQCAQCMEASARVIY